MKKFLSSQWKTLQLLWQSQFSQIDHICDEEFKTFFSIFMSHSNPLMDRLTAWKPTHNKNGEWKNKIRLFVVEGQVSSVRGGRRKNKCEIRRKIHNSIHNWWLWSTMRWDNCWATNKIRLFSCSKFFSDHATFSGKLYSLLLWMILDGNRTPSHVSFVARHLPHLTYKYSWGSSEWTITINESIVKNRII